MNFLEKLDFLMERYGLNKRSLSQKSNIPYTTIDGWYKKGYEGLKLTTLRKIADYFNTTLDYWILDEITDPNYGKTSGFKVDYAEMEHVKKYRALDDHGRKMVDSVLDHESDRVKALEDQYRQILELQREIIPRYIMAYYEKMASAGSGEYLFDDIPTDLIEVPDCPMAHKADFVIGVTGRSMEPTYYDGDKVYVKKMSEIPPGSIGIFVRGNECFIKELGVDRLISHNKKYPDIPASEDIQLVGKVLGKVEET